MAFSPKTWQNSPSTSTPISAASLTDIENRLSAYTDSSVLAALMGNLVTKTGVGGTYTANAGENVLANQASGGFTVTLPTATANFTTTITAGPNITATNKVTVQRGGSSTIYGRGLTAATSFVLGSPGAVAVLQCDGTNWYIIVGAQDSGWVAPSMGTNIGTSNVASRQIGDRITLRGLMTNNTGAGVTSTSTVLFTSTVVPTTNKLFVIQTATSGVMTAIYRSSGIFELQTNSTGGSVNWQNGDQIDLSTIAFGTD